METQALKGRAPAVIQEPASQPSHASYPSNPSVPGHPKYAMQASQPAFVGPSPAGAAQSWPSQPSSTPILGTAEPARGNGGKIAVAAIVLLVAGGIGTGFAVWSSQNPEGEVIPLAPPAPTPTVAGATTEPILPDPGIAPIGAGAVAEPAGGGEIPVVPGVDPGVDPGSLAVDDPEPAVGAGTPRRGGRNGARRGNDRGRGGAQQSGTTQTQVAAVQQPPERRDPPPTQQTDPPRDTTPRRTTAVVVPTPPPETEPRRTGTGLAGTDAFDRAVKNRNPR
jgi:hypothetical protein